MMTPRTQDEYLDLVDQAIFEIEGVLMCTQDEGDPEDSEFSGILPVYELLSKELKNCTPRSCRGNRSSAGGQDLPFMPLVTKWKDRIPCYELLVALNYAHKTGFPS